MKKFKVYSVVACAALTTLSLSSCMKGSNEQSGATFGVIATTESYSNYAKTLVGNITSNDVKFQAATTGDCCLFAYNINYDEQPAGQSKYVTAAISQYTNIEKKYISHFDGEYKPTTEEVPFSAVSPQTFIDDKLFIGCQYKQSKGQVNNYNLYYNITDSVFDDPNDTKSKVYILNFTAKSSVSQTTDATEVVEYVAFDMKRLVEEFKNTSTKDTDYLKIQIKNLREVVNGKDTTMQWVKSEIIPILIQVKNPAEM